MTELLAAGGWLIAGLTVYHLVGVGTALLGAALALFGWELKHEGDEW